MTFEILLYVQFQVDIQLIILYKLLGRDGRLLERHIVLYSRRD